MFCPTLKRKARQNSQTDSECSSMGTALIEDDKWFSSLEATASISSGTSIAFNTEEEYFPATVYYGSSYYNQGQEKDVISLEKGRDSNSYCDLISYYLSFPYPRFFLNLTACAVGAPEIQDFYDPFWLFKTHNSVWTSLEDERDAVGSYLKDDCFEAFLMSQDTVVRNKLVDFAIQISMGSGIVPLDHDVDSVAEKDATISALVHYSIVDRAISLAEEFVSERQVMLSHMVTAASQDKADLADLIEYLEDTLPILRDLLWHVHLCITAVNDSRQRLLEHVNLGFQQSPLNVIPEHASSFAIKLIVSQRSLQQTYAHLRHNFASTLMCADEFVAAMQEIDISPCQSHADLTALTEC